VSSSEGTAHFVGVTEMAGQRAPAEQVDRVCHRYHWAAGYADGKDVLEIACGAGPGLGLLVRHARSLKAGDISTEVLAHAKAVYGKSVDISVFAADALPFDERSFDTVLIFEAIYYLPDAAAALREVRRVLRPSGMLLVVTANHNLFDFNPSPYSTTYFGVADLDALLSGCGFNPAFWGYMDVSRVSLRQRFSRPLKLIATRLGIIPKTLQKKELLKRLVFGSVIVMPGDISKIPFQYAPPTPLARKTADTRHKVIYCAAERL
jgi:SAM-dependent methyltransferase